MPSFERSSTPASEHKEPEEPRGNIEAAILSYIEEEAQKKPIRPGETFDPEEERKELWKLQGEERAAALKEYKEKLGFQKEGLAMMQAELIRVIDKNPDLSIDEAGDVVREFMKNYGLTEEQGKITAKIFGTYKKKHAAVEKISSEHRDPEDLYRTLFAAEPKGEIEVIKGPMTLYFRCHNLEDYARICLQSKLMNEGNRPPTEVEIEKEKNSGGVSITVARIPGLEGTLTAENAKGRLYNKEAEAIHIHEKQHVMKRLVTDAIDVPSINPVEIGEDEKKFREALRKRLEKRKYLVEETVKDEILAYMKAGHFSIESGEITERIMEKFLKKKEEGGLYDYFAEDRDAFLGPIADNYAGTLLIPRESIEGTTKELFDEIYDEQKYEKMIKNGLGVFVKLWRGFGAKADAPYYKDKIIAFLVREPLWKWPRVAQRLLEYRRKEESRYFTEQEEQWFK